MTRMYACRRSGAQITGGMVEELMLLAENLNRYDQMTNISLILLTESGAARKLGPTFTRFLRKIFSKCLYAFSESETFSRICSKKINTTDMIMNLNSSKKISSAEKVASNIFRCLKLGIPDGSLSLTQNGYRIASIFLIGAYF